MGGLMEIDGIQLTRPLLFVLFTMANIAFSWSSLRVPRSHGFYRFFVFEGVLLLLLINGADGPTLAPFWLKHLSLLVLAMAVVLVGAGYLELRRTGGHSERDNSPGNHYFENTAYLVTSGIYRHIRHPMYCSLLFFAWGVFLGYPSWPGLVAVLVTTLFLLAAVQAEERENIAYFGEAYCRYMQDSKMFIPFIY